MGNSARTRGSITAEIAVVLPAVVVLLAILLLAASSIVLQLRLEEGARAGARALARGESTAEALGLASGLAGSGASVSVALSDGYITLTISAKASGPFSALNPWVQSAVATARIESFGGAGNNGRSTSSTAVGTAWKSTLWRWVNIPGEDGLRI